MRRSSLTPILLALLGLVSTDSLAQRDPWQDPEYGFRLLLGSLDGEENSAGLRSDSARYTIGMGAFSPIALDGLLAANLEIWLTERAYDTEVTPPALDSASKSMTFTAVALTYGLRLQPASGRLRPYAMTGLGFQGSRLRTRGTAAGTAETVEEEIITATAQVGIGLEWISGRDSFGIDYRRWFTEGEFRDFGIDDAQLGGEFLGLSLGARW